MTHLQTALHSGWLLFAAGIAVGFVLKRTTAQKPPTHRFAAPPDHGGEYKMMLVVRTDLPMTKGKLAAQCGHAAVACVEAASKSHPAELKRWRSHGQAKIAVRVDSEEQLLDLQRQAEAAGLVAEIVVDAGRTQIDPGSITVLGIGPAPRSAIDPLTSSLRLL